MSTLPFKRISFVIATGATLGIVVSSILYLLMGLAFYAGLLAAFGIEGPYPPITAVFPDRRQSADDKDIAVPIRRHACHGRCALPVLARRLSAACRTTHERATDSRPALAHL